MAPRSDNGGTIQDVLDALKEQGARLTRLEHPTVATAPAVVGCPYAGVPTDENPAFVVEDVAGRPFSHYNTREDAENYVKIMREQGVGGLLVKATP